MIPPPPFVDVGPYHFSISERDLDGVDDAGVTVVDRQTITIVPDLAPDRRAEVVLHECLHAVWALSGIDAKVPEEHVVARLAPHTLALLRANPGLVAFLVTS